MYHTPAAIAPVRNPSAPALTLNASPLRLVILDDVTLYRDGMTLLLSGRDDMLVVGVSTADRDGLRLVHELQPDVVLVVASAAPITTVIHDLTRSVPVARVLAYGVAAGDREAIQCAEAGVSGYIPRDASTDALIATILSVSRGEFACSPRVAALLLRRVADLAGQRGPNDAVVLTPREREVGALIDDGLSNKEIARRLGISVSTVKNHVHHLLEKLHTDRRVQVGAQIRRARI